MIENNDKYFSKRKERKQVAGQVKRRALGKKQLVILRIQNLEDNSYGTIVNLLQCNTVYFKEEYVEVMSMFESQLRLTCSK